MWLSYHCEERMCVQSKKFMNSLHLVQKYEVVTTYFIRPTNNFYFVNIMLISDSQDKRHHNDGKFPNIFQITAWQEQTIHTPQNICDRNCTSSTTICHHDMSSTLSSTNISHLKTMKQNSERPIIFSKRSATSDDAFCAHTCKIG